MWPGVRGEDRLDRFVGFKNGVVLVIDGDAVEQYPVEYPSFGWFGLGADLVDVGEEPEARVESDRGLVVVIFNKSSWPVIAWILAAQGSRKHGLDR